jgi:FkbM family methyltransferase
MLIRNKPIDIDAVLANAKPRGVIHCGAFEAEELPLYQKHGIANRCWIEADPDRARELKKIVPKEDIVIGLAVANWNGNGQFTVMDNGASSSLLVPKKHLEYYPDIKPVKDIKVDVRTLDFLVGCGAINMDKYDMLYMDLQGGEWLAIDGFRENIKNINYILSEINYEELYAGCMLINEFDEILRGFGFEKQWATIHETVGWGDAYYKRV